MMCFTASFEAANEIAVVHTFQYIKNMQPRWNCHFLPRKELQNIAGDV